MPSGFKLLMLLSTPFPLHPLAAIRFARHSRLPLEALSSTAASRGRLFSAAPSSKLGLSIRAAEQVHTKAVAKEGCSETVTSYPGFKDSYSWPEWSKLADHLLARGYSQRPVAPGNEDDFLLTDVVLPEQFLKAAEACLDFARERPDILRLLTKRYIELVVNNGSPFLFKNGEKSVSRMRLFLSGDASSALESEKAQTIDIMCYLLSYMYKTFFASSGDQIKADESVETSVRKLLYELFNFIGQRSKLAEPTKTELCLGNEQLTRPTGKSFEIKRGDWICQKCTFLNFARNMSCLECGEARPRRQLTGAEWECPQCDFFNYGRNTSCLRCDCRRPGEVLLSPAPTAGVGLGRSSNIEQKISVPSHGGSSMRSGTDNTSDTISRSLDRILGRSSTPSGNLSSDVDSNTSSLGNFSSSQFGQNMAKQRRNTDNVSFVPLPPDMFRKTQEPEHGVQQSSGKGVASSPNTSDLVDSLIMSYENSTKSSNNKDSSDVSLRWPKTAVELENAKDPANAVSDEDFSNIMPIRKEENRFVVSEKDRSSTSSLNNSDLFDSLTKSSENSMKSSSSKDSSDVSLRWSKTAAELENAKDPANAVSDEDFPDIMPIRKGENRFVVSKKKDRSLTSPAYKRRLAMEQANNYNTVPFVPFPPGYFAKKDNQLATDSIESTAPLDKIETLPEKQREQESGISDQGLAGTSSPQSGGKSYGDSYKSEFSDMNLNQNNFKHNRETLNSTKKSSTFEDNASYSSPYYTSRPDSNLGKYSGYTASSTQQSSNSLNNSTSYGETTANSSQPLNTNWPNYDSSSAEYTTYGGPSASSSHPPASSWRDSKGRVNNEPVVSPQKPPNLQSTGNIPSGGYSGKSLEGSCVKETDPLDMSEEAKAERWFRRVAQIKDISELSQIPDEDFPEIMPMRKGVNRFVVSKRKTPLERRLTSPQYRRNLPIVSSETEKDDN